ncbi:hypothetical protein RHGRI_022355 [Rhododendron griersonianum]|uniref:Uncharacterized protein n=1 Tax=Rhododendron griersonianum TaxID=479676 RepID=A0AAV6J3N4_9ERIC|nr:hypothetical protein RHGRI_022355 [Rhododendron griersonianum]
MDSSRRPTSFRFSATSTSLSSCSLPPAVSVSSLAKEAFFTTVSPPEELISTSEELQQEISNLQQQLQAAEEQLR